MADLPADHVSTDAPFTNVGLDVFSPWTVMTRNTTGGHAQSKRWAVIFTCLSVSMAPAIYANTQCALNPKGHNCSCPRW